MDCGKSSIDRHKFFWVKGKITGGRTPATRILLTFKKILLWWHECMGFGEIPWGDELF
jgi:hypothetical protein